MTVLQHVGANMFSRALAFFYAIMITGWSIAEENRIPDSFRKDANGSLVPKESAVGEFSGKVTLQFAPEEQRTLVSDRILDGFEAGQSSVEFDRNNLVAWGFKHQEPSIQSVVAADRDGTIRIAAAVRNITRLTRTDRPPVTTMHDYQNKIKKGFGGQPSITLFVGNEKDLRTYWPIIKRWSQANLLGFNADCGSRDLSEACEFAQELDIPATAYVIRKSAAGEPKRLERVEVPPISPAKVPIEIFKQ